MQVLKGRVSLLQAIEEPPAYQMEEAMTRLWTTWFRPSHNVKLTIAIVVVLA